MIIEDGYKEISRLALSWVVSGRGDVSTECWTRYRKQGKIGKKILGAAERTGKDKETEISTMFTEN